MNKPLVSVIIPLYNGEKFIRQTIQSALKQTFEDFEIIVIDDGSTDNSSKIVKELAKKDNRIKYIYQKNKGVSAARNKGIERSRGEYLALLDADDLWFPQKLEKQMNLFKNNEKLGLVFSDALYLQHGVKMVTRMFGGQIPQTRKVFRKLLRNNFIPCFTAVIKKKALPKDWFDERLGMVEEYDLFLRIAKNWEVDHISKPLGVYRMHPDNYTTKNYEKSFIEGEYLLRKYNILFAHFEQQYAREVAAFKRKLDYFRAIYAWKNERGVRARKYLRKHLFSDVRLVVVYTLTFFHYETFERAKAVYKKLFV